jgi:hypothetical protein
MKSFAYPILWMFSWECNQSHCLKVKHEENDYTAMTLIHHSGRALKFNREDFMSVDKSDDCLTCSWSILQSSTESRRYQKTTEDSTNLKMKPHWILYQAT